MRLVIAVLLSGLLGATVAPAAERAPAGPRTALCLVCKVTHGEAAEEPVRAVRTHEGVEYGFCSEKCAEAFAAEPLAYLPLALPRPAPAFALKDLTGRTLSNENLKGQVVLLDFWATWCAPCRKAMPELQALHLKYADRGFTVVGVSIDEDGPARVRKFVGARKITYPVALDSEESPAWEAYRVKAVPAAFLLDQRGRIVAQWTGIPADPKELAARIEGLLSIDAH